MGGIKRRSDSVDEAGRKKTKSSKAVFNKNDKKGSELPRASKKVDAKAKPSQRSRDAESVDSDDDSEGSDGSDSVASIPQNNGPSADTEVSATGMLPCANTLALCSTFLKLTRYVA